MAPTTNSQLGRNCAAEVGVGVPPTPVADEDVGDHLSAITGHGFVPRILAAIYGKTQRPPGVFTSPLTSVAPGLHAAPRMSRTILEVSGLQVQRGRAAILRGIDWRVQRGEHWTILGANGSGKTSLLKAITGYMPPTAGRITLLGGRYGACDWRELRLHVGVVTSAFAIAIPPAEPAIETVVSGRYAQLDLWQAGTRADRRAALRLLKFVGLGRLAEREWTYLSQGERQRVLIARALMSRPRLLVLDEPCAGLDPVAREKFLRFINRLAGRRQAPALVLVTHHVEEIVPALTHALVLREGRVVASGPRHQVLTSRHLGAAFGARLRLQRIGRRYRLEVMAA